MVWENIFLIGVLIGLITGITIAILISYTNTNNPKSVLEKEELNLERRVSPFIEIHESLLLESEPEPTSASAERLKVKIEGFKNRNRFYQL